MIRAADLRGADADAVGALVGEYLSQTEREKAAHGVGALRREDGADELPAVYREEADDPARAYAGWPVLVAEVDGAIVGGIAGTVVKVALPVAVTFATGWLVLKGLGKLRAAASGRSSAA